MNRRTFLGGLVATAVLLPSSLSIAKPTDAPGETQPPVPAPDPFRDIPLETVSPDSATWLDGISDGTKCTFDET